jgi:hypothetical protein
MVAAAKIPPRTMKLEVCRPIFLSISAPLTLGQPPADI